MGSTACRLYRTLITALVLLYKPNLTRAPCQLLYDGISKETNIDFSAWIVREGDASQLSRVHKMSEVDSSVFLSPTNF